jgi:hypothetical protein
MSIVSTKNVVKRPGSHDDPGELTLDNANEMSFPASDPIATSNILRIEVAPEMSPANTDHQISSVVKVIHNTSENRESLPPRRKDTIPWAFSGWFFMNFNSTK